MRTTSWPIDRLNTKTAKNLQGRLPRAPRGWLGVVVVLLLLQMLVLLMLLVVASVVVVVLALGLEVEALGVAVWQRIGGWVQGGGWLGMAWEAQVRTDVPRTGPETTSAFEGEHARSQPSQSGPKSTPIPPPGEYSAAHGKWRPTAGRHTNFNVFKDWVFESKTEVFFTFRSLR